MKGYVIVVMFVFGLVISLTAQTDGFFTWAMDDNYMKNTKYELLQLPEHGSDYNYCADNVPLESGCLVLLGMAIAYAKFKKQNNRSLM